jgi:hypothetical protein
MSVIYISTIVNLKFKRRPPMSAPAANNRRWTRIQLLCATPAISYLFYFILFTFRLLNSSFLYIYITTG